MKHSAAEVSVIACELNAKGSPLKIEFHPDGDVVIWNERGLNIELDSQDIETFKQYRQHQEDLMRNLKGIRRPLPPNRVALPTALSSPRDDASGHVMAPRQDKAMEVGSDLKVARENTGWGATVQIDGFPVRYHYRTREQARRADPKHEIGDGGRVS